MIWPLIILSYISLFAVGLSDNIRGPLFPEILSQFHLTDGQGSWMFAISSFCAFLGSYSCHHFLKKWSHLKLLDFALLILAVGLFGIAFSPNYGMLLLAACFSGFGTGILGVTQNILVSRGTLLHHRRQTLSGLHSMYGIASLLAPVIVAVVSYFLFSWRGTFAAAATIPLAILVYSFFNNPHIETRDPVANSADLKSPKKIAWDQIYLACALGAYVLAEVMVSSRLALFVRREQNVGLELSTLYVAGFFLCLLLGRLLFTWKRFEGSVKNQLLLSLGISFVLILAGIFVNPLFLILVGLSMAPFFPLAIAHISDSFPRHLDSAISYTMAAQSLLLVVMHTSVGYLTDWLGMTAALLVGPFFLLVSFVILSTFQALFRPGESAVKPS